MHVEMHLYLALRIVSALPSAVMWKGLTQGLTPGATDGAFSYPSCTHTHDRAHKRARAHTHTQTHEKHKNIAIFVFVLPFSWVAWLLKRSTRVIPRLWRPDRIIAHLVPVNETWDIDGHATGVHLRWEYPRMPSDAGEKKEKQKTKQNKKQKNPPTFARRSCAQRWDISQETGDAQRAPPETRMSGVRGFS